MSKEEVKEGNNENGGKGEENRLLIFHLLPFPVVSRPTTCHGRLVGWLVQRLTAGWLVACYQQLVGPLAVYVTDNVIRQR